MCGIAQVMCTSHIVKLGLHSIVFKMTEVCLGTLAQGGTLAWPCDHAAASHDVIFSLWEAWSGSLCVKLDTLY